MNEEDFSVSRSSTQKLQKLLGLYLSTNQKQETLSSVEMLIALYSMQKKKEEWFFSIKVKHKFILLWTFFILNIVSYREKYLPGEKHNKEDLYFFFLNKSRPVLDGLEAQNKNTQDFCSGGGMWVAASSFKDQGPVLRNRILCSFGVDAQSKAIVVLELRDHKDAWLGLHSGGQGGAATT